MNRKKKIGNWPFIIDRKINYTQLLTIFCLLIFCSACNSDFVQKERGFFKIPLPAKKYQLFNQPNFPYTFEYPVYSTIIPDSTFFDEKAENPYWINIDFPQFNG